MQSFLLRLDAFRKVPTELTNPTMHGAYLTVFAYLCMVILFLFELHAFWTPSVHTSVALDKNFANTISIDFDIVMHNLPCKYTNVVVRNSISNEEVQILSKNLRKEKISKEGVFKGIHENEPSPATDHHHDEKHPELDADWDSTSDHFKHGDFNKVLEYHDFTVINFYASWCIHCRRFAPTWNEAEKKAEQMNWVDANNQQVVTKLLRVNCVEFQELCMQLGVRAYPTVRVYKRDKTFAPYMGHRRVDDILDFVREFVGKEQVHQAAETAVHHSEFEEGCRVAGEIQVRRVPGYFHLDADSKADSLDPKMTNVSHTVNHLWFVDDREQIKTYLQTASKALTSEVLKNIQPMADQEFFTYDVHTAPQHYLTVVSTVVDDGKVIVYQSTVQSDIQKVQTSKVPQAKFSYTFSPMSVVIEEERRPFYDFMTSIFAIVGGTYTFVSLVDKFFDTVSTYYKGNINKLG